MKNSKPIVAYRTLNQWCRRRLVLMLPWLFKSLRDERIMLASAKLRTSYTLKRLRRINWLIGQGSVFSFTDAERKELNRIADEILTEMGV